MIDPQKAALNNEYTARQQAASRIIFEQHRPREESMATRFLGKKEAHWVIPFDSKEDRDALLQALKTQYMRDEELVVKGRRSGMIIIDNDRGRNKFEKRKKEFEAESHPRWLDYEQLCSKPASELDSYLPHHSDVEVLQKKGWVGIDYRNRQSYFNPEPEEDIIGKFHISVNKDDVPKAWNLIAHELIDQHVVAKVRKPEKLVDRPENDPHQGKHIVLYFTRNNIRDTDHWQQVLDAIETTFVAHGIRKGPEVLNSRPMEGSAFSYLHYGNSVYDETTGAGNAWDDDMRVFNGGVDAFAGMKITASVVGSRANRLDPVQDKMRDGEAEGRG